MEIKFNKNFLKQLAKLPKDVRGRIEAFVFVELPGLRSVGGSGKIEKMQGYDFCYKVRFGNYRIGLIYQNDIITLKIVMHRREIYRFFP